MTLTESQRRLLGSMRKTGQIWDAMCLLPRLMNLQDLGLIDHIANEQPGLSDVWVLTENGREVLGPEKEQS